jgi:GT2 family glycosyltransferase
VSPAPKDPSPVEAVIVNRDGGEALLSALASLEAQEGIPVSIVVVDNGSRPGERERIARRFPGARVIAFSRNLGFAGASNEGIARTRSPYLLLLNNDAVLSPDYVARLAARLSRDPRLAAVQGLVLTADGSRVDTAGIVWTARGEAVPVLAGLDPSSAPGEAFEVPGISATAALYRRQALEAIGNAGAVFDQSFFAYYEDADLSLRLLRAGWRFLCEPAARARHQGSRTGRRTPWRRAVWTARNRWRTLFRNFEPRTLRRHFRRLLRADLAHARHLGWRGPVLPLIVWPALPLLALRWRGERGRLSEFPSMGAGPQAGPG